jgi:uncharacterized Zn finger protein
VDVLRKLAGAKVFARGEAYYRDGQVEIVLVKPGRVLAQVAGTEDYRTELTGSGKDFDGECSCRAWEDFGFCKHLVATALAVNDHGADDGPSALTRIRDHLKQKGVDALVEMVLDLAEQDLALFRKLDAAAELVHADDKTLTARLRKMMDGATRTRSFVDYHQASGWAAQVDSVLDTIAALTPGARAGVALDLAEYAIDSIEQAIEEIDDSDGHCGALLGRARDIHLAAVREVRPDPVRLARDLFAREMAEAYGTFEGAVALYADILGDIGLAEYRRLATEKWEKLPSIGRREASDEDEDDEDESFGDQHRLMWILDFFAERAGEVDTRIALRAKDLSSQWSYLQLAEFCRSQGREEEALRRAEEGLWIFEDARPDERLVLFVVELLSKAGRKADAEAHLQRAFEKMPTLELYKRLRKFGGDAARERAVKLLEARQGRRERPGWLDPDHLLIRIWMHEKMFDAAWAAVRKLGASAGFLKDELATASESTHPREAVEVYAEQVERLAVAGSASAYAEAAKLVARMAKLRSRTEQVTYVLELKVRHGRKRNFMKLLG